MSREGTGTFSLSALDAGEFFSDNSQSAFPAEWITLTGHQAGGGVVTHSFNLDGLRDGAGGIPDFEHFVLPPTFVNLRSVVFAGWRAGGIAGDVSWDNLEYELDSPQAIPPCTFIDTHPLVSIVSPAQGAVTGVVTIDVNAVDNVALASVAVRIDGVAHGLPMSSPPYQIQWDTTTVADGIHTIQVEAIDTTNVGTTATTTVAVQNNVVVGQDPHYVSFDGVQDAAFVADGPALSFGNGTTDSPFTIEMWVRPDSVLGPRELIAKAGEYRVAFVHGTLLVQLLDNNSFVFVQTAPLTGMVGSWHHVAVTYDGRGGAAAGNGITIYVDGVAMPVVRETAASYVAMENLASVIEIGGNDEQANHYVGGLDELRIWNAVRSASEIQFAMGAELTGVEAGLIGYWRFNEGAGQAVADDSPNTQAMIAINAIWLPDGPLAPDTTAPQIGTITVSNVTSSRATISFSTDETAVAYVSYAPGACPCTDVYSAGPGTSHTILLTGLAANTVYQFTVTARDSANNLQTSAPMNFQTLVQSTDVLPPTVTFVTPAAGPVSGTVTIEATATDAVGVTSVEFFVGGVSLGAADTAAPYTLQWNTTALADGPYTIVAEARDAADNLGTASRAVTLQNGVVMPGGPHYVTFDGVNDTATVADAPALSFGNGTSDTPFTIEMWLRPDSVLGARELIAKAGEYRVAFTHGTVFVQLLDSSAAANAAVQTGSLAGMTGWHHLAVTYDGRGGATAANGITVYVDGVPQPLVRENAANYVAMENLASPIELGGNNDQANHYAGGFDDLRLWHVARSQAEILGGLSAELTGGEAGLGAYWRFNEGIGTTVADDSLNNSVVTLVNGVLWAAGGPLAPDTTSPQISNVVVSNITPSGATVTFTTDEPTTGSIVYGAGTEVFSSGIGTAHTIALAGLTPATNYLFTAHARDAANNLQVSPEMNFTTLEGVADGIAPNVAFVTPAAGTVAGTVQVEATATDNVGVVSVTFLLDGVSLGAPDTTAPYAVSWDSVTVADGAHTLTAEARDASNNVASASVIVLVDNTPANPGGPHYVSFDGVNDGATVADAPALSFGNGTIDTPFTIEMWVRPDIMLGPRELIAKAGEYRVAFTQGTLFVQLLDNSTRANAAVQTGSLASIAGGWHHLAVTYDGRGGATAANGITVYVDGVPQSLVRENAANYLAMENLATVVELAGNDDQANHYAGGLDDLRVWHVVRTQAEILGAMSAELTGGEPGLVAYWRFNEGLGTSVADDSLNNSVVTLVNGVLWAAGGPLAPDTTSPQISNVVVSNITPSGATVTFTTDEPTTGSIVYGAGTEVFGSGVSTTHVIALSGLTPATGYEFTARARDAANNLQVSPPMNFTTLAGVADGIAPNVAFVTPAAGTVAGLVPVEATATDNVGVVSVSFQLDGMPLGAPDTTAPYALSWDSVTVADGAHTLTVEARDASNNIASASVIVLVDNTPANPGGPHYVSFDGVNDTARITDAPALSFGNGTTDTAFTIEMWVRPDSVLGPRELVAKAGEYRVAFTQGTLFVQLLDNSAGANVAVQTGSLAAIAGGWHHLAVTYDGRGGATAANGITVYVDGVPQSLVRENAANYLAMENLANVLEIAGNDDQANHYAGGFDELRLWHVARTPEEILSTLSVELTGGEPGLGGYWRFNEGLGTSVPDDSLNNSSITLVNGVIWTAGGPF